MRFTIHAKTIKDDDPSAIEHFDFEIEAPTREQAGEIAHKLIYDVLDPGWSIAPLEIMITSQELARVLRRLDSLYLQKQTSRSWLKGYPLPAELYTQEKTSLEHANPGLRVVYVDITSRMAHALIPMEEEENSR